MVTFITIVFVFVATAIGDVSLRRGRTSLERWGPRIGSYALLAVWMLFVGAAEMTPNAWWAWIAAFIGTSIAVAVLVPRTVRSD